MSKSPTASMNAPPAPGAAPPGSGGPGGAASQVGLKSGTKLGKYEIVGRLGLGGMALVYKGYDPLLDRFVAIKQISSHLAADPKFLDRFRKEAQILAKLGADQSCVVQIYELIEDPRGLFIVMEYVEGQTLDVLIARQKGPMPVQLALEILWHVAAGLRAVHERGIIHRDIKPANIMVAVNHRCKITDFGVAAHTGGKTSMTLGTTKYMAPELFGGPEVDGRVDIYSLGCIAYEMLCGPDKFKQIFNEVVRDERSESLRWMKWHTNAELMAPMLHQVNPKAPEVLGKIVAKMMAKNPEQRFSSAEHLLGILKRHFTQQGKVLKAVARSRQQTAAPAAPPVEERRPEPIPQRQAAVAAPAPVAAGPAAESAGPKTTRLPKRKMTRRQRFIALGVAAGVLIAVLIGLHLNSRWKQDAVQARAGAGYEQAKKLWTEGEFAKAETILMALRNDPDADDRAAALWPAGGEVYASAITWLSELSLDVSKADTRTLWPPGSEEFNRARMLLAGLRGDPKVYEDALRPVPAGAPEADLPRQWLMAAQSSPTAKAEVLKMLRARHAAEKPMVDQVRAMQADESLGRTVWAQRYAPIRMAWLQGRQALLEKNWDAARAADRRMGEELNALTPEEGREIRKEIQAFEVALRNEEAFTNKVADAMAMIDEGLETMDAVRFDDAREALDTAQAWDRGKDMREQYSRLVNAREEYRYRDLVRQAKALEAGKPDQAAEIYRRAQAIHNRPEVRERLSKIDDDRRYGELTGRAAAAYRSNNAAEAIRLYEQAHQMRPSADLAATITKAKAAQAYANGMSALGRGDEPTAEAQFRVAERLDPTLKGRIDSERAKIKTRNEFAIRSRGAEQAFGSGDFDLAIKEAQAALRIQQDAKLVELVRQSNIKRKLNDGEQLARQRKWTDAESAFKQARNLLKIDEKSTLAMIDRRLAEWQRDRDYLAHLDAGDKLFAEAKYDEALEAFKRARKVYVDAKADTREIDGRIKEANYSRFLHAGRIDMERKMWHPAKSWFERAKEQKDTDEVRNLIAACEMEIAKESQATGG